MNILEQTSESTFVPEADTGTDSFSGDFRLHEAVIASRAATRQSPSVENILIQISPYRINAFDQFDFLLSEILL